MAPSDRIEGDIFARVDYRRLIAWPERIKREAPLLLNVLGRAPLQSVLDLGCGPGEHSRFLCENGFRVLGIDRSPAMLEKAREEGCPSGLRFAEGDLTELEAVVHEPFGAAISLGNTLPFLLDVDKMRCFLKGLASSLAPGGVFLLQILNYERIFEKKLRHLPINFIQGSEEGTETIFLRLMEPLGGGRVRFCPTALKYCPGAEEPLVVENSRVVELKGWVKSELEELLEEAGFQPTQTLGDMQGGEYLASESTDLVIVATREV